MRHYSLQHLAGIGTASGKEASRQIPSVVSADGSRANEGLSQRALTSRLAADALKSAIELRCPLPGVVHHSDRGVQYTSPEYVAILKQHGMVRSMSRPADPYDNASCESFIKTLKREEIYANKYRDLEDLRSHIEEFIDGCYNQKRLSDSAIIR